MAMKIFESSMHQIPEETKKKETTPVEFIEITPVQKKIALKIVCQDKYTEKDLIYIRISSNLTMGWAFTKDSFCYREPDRTVIIPYKDIKSLDLDKFTICIHTSAKKDNSIKITPYQLLVKENESLSKKIIDYLRVAKML